MSTSSKRRQKKKPTHQSIKAAEHKKKGINWLHIVAIVVGLLIVASMVLSLFIVPGAI